MVSHAVDCNLNLVESAPIPIILLVKLLQVASWQYNTQILLGKANSTIYVATTLSIQYEHMLTQL